MSEAVASPRLKLRLNMSRDRWVRGTVVVLALPALLIPLFILGYILYRGGAALNWEFLAGHAEGAGFGVSGGIGGQLAGSLLLALGAILLATPLAWGTALHYHLSASAGQRRLLELSLQMLQGIPPIVFGLCGLIIFVHLLRWGVSLAAGAMILAGVILPMLTLNAIACLERIPPEYTEAGLSLGLSQGALIRRVWLPQAWRGLLTGQLLAVARALSETAPILFTATVFSGVVWPDSVFSPVTSLQTHIFYLAQEGSDPRAIEAAWGSAVVLIACVAGFGLLARWLNRMGGTQ